MRIWLLLCVYFIYNSVASELGSDDIGFIDYTPAPPRFAMLNKQEDECPPCFNCMLPGFECLHFANCSEYDGKCNCPPGFGGNDCRQPCNVSLLLLHKTELLNQFIL
jgi:hypothetical protein